MAARTEAADELDPEINLQISAYIPESTSRISASAISPTAGSPP